MIDSVEIRPGAYYDSVRLMQASQALQLVPDVEDALVAMGTDLNRELAMDMGFDPGSIGHAGPNDLLVAIRAVDEKAAAAAIQVLESTLAARTEPGAGVFAAPPAHVIGSVAAGANLALISVPGEHAFVEAMDALRHDLSVMVFSDNMPVEQEVVLKKEAERLGLLVMGPDCGTAIVNGVGLGFANVTQPGPVGIVGAAGTGIQQLCCLLDAAGVGVRNALGTGSRDLSVEVGGSSTLRGLEALDADPSTEVLIVVSKPPSPEVAAKVEAAAADCSTPTVLAFLGEEGVTLEGAVGQTLDLAGKPPPVYASWPAVAGDHRPGYLRGLFSGGSLRSEAAVIASGLGMIGHDEHAGGHTLVDFGSDRYTLGRAHPMIDQRLRLQHLEEAAFDPAAGVILLDVVLGHGAHPDPASELAPVIDIARAEGPAVVVSLCGTTDDPQDRERQARLLNEAGASVWLSNAAAARHAVSLTEDGRHE
ncbi:MAG: FdrA family protein [Actinomycetota bacterium]|nr:FdrA family protein [Actinomycetota bacterium]